MFESIKKFFEPNIDLKAQCETFLVDYLRRLNSSRTEQIPDVIFEKLFTGSKTNFQFSITRNGKEVNNVTVNLKPDNMVSLVSNKYGNNISVPVDQLYIGLKKILTVDK